MGNMTEVYCLDDNKARAMAASPKGRTPPPYDGHWPDRVVAAEIAENRQVCGPALGYRLVVHSIVLSSNIQAVTVTVHLGARDIVVFFADADSENITFPGGGYRLPEGSGAYWSTNVAGNAAISVFGDWEPIP